MNENINLTKILKNCPKGWKLWSPIFGVVKFEIILEKHNIVIIDVGNEELWTFNSDATFPIGNFKSVEIMLYPSRENRDWSKFTAPWHEKERDTIACLEEQDKKSSWKPSKEEMDVLYSLSYITNEYDEYKEDVITHLYQDLKREFFNGSSYENMFSLGNKEDDVRRRSTIQVLEYARSLDAYNQYGKADIDKNIAWLEKQRDKDKLIQELGEYKVKYTQEVSEKCINSMSNKDDERLRKTAIAFLKDFAEQGYENAVECIDWLEKLK